MRHPTHYTKDHSSRIVHPILENIFFYFFYFLAPGVILSTTILVLCIRRCKDENLEGGPEGNQGDDKKISISTK